MDRKRKMTNQENKRQFTEPGEKQMHRLTRQSSINSGKPNCEYL